MPVKYIIVPYKIPSKPNEPVVYYPRLKSSGEINLREIARAISNISTVSTVDTIAVLEGLLQIIPNNIAKGKIVKLGDFGSFYLTIKAEGASDAGSVTPTRIIKNKLHFRAGKIMQQVLNTIKYEKDE